MKRSKVFFSKLLIVALLVSLLAPMGALAAESEAVEPTTVDAEPVSEALAVEPEAAEESDEEPEMLSSLDADVETSEDETVPEVVTEAEVPAELESEDAVSAMEESVDETSVEEEVLDTETEVAEETAMEEASSEPAAEGAENTFTVGQTIRFEESGSCTVQFDLGESGSKQYLFIWDATCKAEGDSVQLDVSYDGWHTSWSKGYSWASPNRFYYYTVDFNEIYIEATLFGSAVAELTVFDLTSVSQLTFDTEITVENPGLYALNYSEKSEYSLNGIGSGSVKVLSKSQSNYVDWFTTQCSMGLPCENRKLMLDSSDATYYLCVLPEEDAEVKFTLNEEAIPEFAPGTITIEGQSSAIVNITEPGFYTISSEDGYDAEVWYSGSRGEYLSADSSMTLNTEGVIKIYNCGNQTGRFTVKKATATPIAITQETDLKSGSLYSFSIEKDGTYVFMSADNNDYWAKLFRNEDFSDYINGSCALYLTSGTYELLSSGDVNRFIFGTLADIATPVGLNQLQQLVLEETSDSTQAYYKVSVPADGYYALEYQGDYGCISGVWSENCGELNRPNGDHRQFYSLQKGDTLYLGVACYSYRGDDSQKSVPFALSGPIDSGTNLVLNTATDAEAGIPSNRYTFTVSEAGNYGFEVTGDYVSSSSSFSIWNAEGNLLYEDVPMESAIPLEAGSYSVLAFLSSDSDDLSITLTKPEKTVIRSGEMTSVTWKQYNTGELVFNLKEGYETGAIESRLGNTSANETYIYYYADTRSDLWSGFITKVNIQEGITVIGDGAFYGLAHLKDVTLPSTVKIIGALAFADSGVESISLPKQMDSIGCYAFAGCSSLKSISLPQGLTEIEYSAFANCTSLSSVDIPEGVVRLEYNAFSGCTSLKEVELPDSVTELQYASFYGCSSLKTFTVPSGMLEMNSALERSGVEKVYVYADSCEFSGATFGGVGSTNYTWNEDGSYTTQTVLSEQGGIVVYGNLNSTAQAYCKELGYTFALLVETKEADIPTVDPEAEAGTAGVSSESLETASKVAEEATAGLLELLADDGDESGEESSALTETEQEINDNVIAITDAEALQKMKESKGSIQAAVVVNVVEEGSESSESSEEEQQKVQNALAELKADDKNNQLEVIQTLDISVNLVASYKDGEETKTETVGQVKQSSETMTFSVVLSNEQVEALTGENINIYVMRVHDGQVTLIPATLEDNILSFESDCFSLYSIISSTKELISRNVLDMDGNGEVDIQDVIHLVRYILGLTNVLHADGDTNSDSRTVGLADVIHLLRAVMDQGSTEKSTDGGTTKKTVVMTG